MYDVAKRVALVKRRVRENRRREERRRLYGLSALCMGLLAVLVKTAGAVIEPAQTAAQGIFGAMLLREDAGGYVLVGVVSFAAAVTVTVLCIRFRDRDRRKKDGAGETDPREQEGKKR